LTSNSLRAASHSARETTLGCSIWLLVMKAALLIVVIRVFSSA
jgi:hypothetical protein